MTALVSVLLAVGGAAAGQDEFDLWDQTDDGFLDYDEFGVAWRDTFESLDEDESGFLDEDELGGNTPMAENGFDYYDWDADEDGLLGEDEYVDGAFGMFDENQDDYIDEYEWDAGLNELGY